MLNFEFQDEIRAQEISATVAVLGQPPAQLLEIGAGAGVQSKYLAELGFDVKAVDLAGSLYETLRVFQVLDYDGRTLPFADHSFDVIYSSHVLMHIVDRVGFHAEIKRVLKPGGRAVHVVPTTAWRFWTCVLHYPDNVLSRGWRLVTRPALSAAEAVAAARPSVVVGATHAPQSKMARWLRLPPRIGEQGNVISEHFLFSDTGWRRSFKQHGFDTVLAVPNGIFYTGHMFLSSKVSLPARRWLSRFLGSAGRAYVLQAQPSAQ
jgi:SAM-dependent methyltransferase